MQRRNGPGRAACYLGLCALLVSVMPGVGLVVSGIAVWLGIIGVRRAKRFEATNRGQAQFGLFAGSIAAVVAVATSVLVIIFWPQVSDLRRCYNDATTDSEQEQCTKDFQDAIDARL
jgi:hypothetical protein